MARAFAHIAFTPGVLATQSRLGSREAYRETTSGPVETVQLGAREAGFIEARDSFYQGTVGENGWPYVQHRGGPAGFLRVLGPTTIGYADFSGNRQYISVGNLSGDDRVSLFLIDYRAQRRLKIWGRARLVDERTEPEVIARLESPDYRARIERGVIITVEAFDWNCPKHITPRFTESEVRLLLDDARHEAEASLAGAAAEATTTEAGTGPLKLVVSGIRELTPRVRAFELRAADFRDVPAVTAGAHLVVPIRLPDGNVVTRQYSVTSAPDRRDIYEIAVLREDGHNSGSAAIHASWQLGTRIAVDPPLNHFPLHMDERHAVLVAGGIGITPIRAMSQALRARRGSFELHYSGRVPAEMAYQRELAADSTGTTQFYFTQGETPSRLDLKTIVAAAPADALFYVCGPARLIDTAKITAAELGISPDRLQFEHFG